METQEEFNRIKKALLIPMTDLPLDVRCYDALVNNGIDDVCKIVNLDQSDLLKLRGFGKKSLVNLEECIVGKLRLSFGMDVTKYIPPVIVLKKMTTDEKIKRIYFLDKEIGYLKALDRSIIRFNQQGEEKIDTEYTINVRKRLERFTKEIKQLLPDD